MHYEKFPDGTVKCIEDEIPFELPEGWEWTRLQAICEPITDGTHKTPTYSDEGFIFLSSKNVTSGHIDWDNIMYIPESLHNELYARLAPQKNDILLAKNGTTGVAAIVDRDCIFDIYVSLALLRIIGYIISPEYLLSTIASSTIQNYFNSSLKGIGVPNLHLEHIRTTLIPVAPINEQYRIATKLEQLLSFADNIESDKTDLQTTIQLTKSKILDLAIRGKLVPQNPDDEPANVLLDRIRAEKEGLIKQGKIKRDKKESVIFKGDDNSYYLRMGNLIETLDDWRINDIPYSWGICCLGEVCDYGNCTNVDTKDIPKTAWILDLEDIEKDTGKVSQKLTLKERNSASTKHSFHKGQVLYSKLRPYLNKVVLVDDDGYCTSEILPLDFNKYILPEYAKYYLMSPTFLRYANHCSYGVKMPRLGTLDGRKAVLIVPPVNEQKRIADKVSQLFSLLDSIADNVN
mgnify:CR=1 FL=1